MLKSSICIVLIINLLSSTIGITLTSHICAGKTIKSALNIGKSDISCGMKMKTCKKYNPLENSLKRECCKNIYEKINMDNFHIYNLNIKIFNFFIKEFYYKVIELKPIATQVIYPTIKGPPLIKKITLLFQNIRI